MLTRCKKWTVRVRVVMFFVWRTLTLTSADATQFYVGQKVNDVGLIKVHNTTNKPTILNESNVSEWARERADFLCPLNTNNLFPRRVFPDNDLNTSANLMTIRPNAKITIVNKQELHLMLTARTRKTRMDNSSVCVIVYCGHSKLTHQLRWRQQRTQLLLTQ